jgi:N-methylhydantoinase A
MIRGERSKMKIAEQTRGPKDASSAMKRMREVYSKELADFTEIACYDGERLKHGNVVTGPAIIEERTTTVVIPGDTAISVDRWGNYLGGLL